MHCTATRPRSTDTLFHEVYSELRRLAKARLDREHGNLTLDPTCLVHETYLRLRGNDPDAPAHWDDRRHLLAAAAEAMRRALIDRARARSAARRGHGKRPLRLDASPEQAVDARPDDWLALDDALQRLMRDHPESAELVRLRIYLGLTVGDAADALGCSRATAERRWRFARAWLYDAVHHPAAPAVDA